MKGTRFKPIIREFLGQFNREIRVSLTPVPKNKTWVFLVGCYNSGTTLLAELLGQHPDISALSTEGHFITDQFIKDYDVGLPRMWVGREDIFCLTEDDNGPDPIRIQKEWGMRLDLTKSVLLEKSPPNSAKTRWLQKHFENAHFIGIVRNGYAVSEGISRKAEPRHLLNGWPIEMSAYQWMRSNEILKSDAMHLKHFVWVKYEDLVDDIEGTLNKLAEFIGISTFQSFEKGREWRIHERNDRIKNLNRISIEKLSHADIDRINTVAGELIQEFGYRKL